MPFLFKLIFLVNSSHLISYIKLSLCFLFLLCILLCLQTDSSWLVRIVLICIYALPFIFCCLAVYLKDFLRFLWLRIIWLWAVNVLLIAFINHWFLQLSRSTLCQALMINYLGWLVYAISSKTFIFTFILTIIPNFFLHIVFDR